MSAPIVWRGFPFSPFNKLTVYFILLTNSTQHNHSRAANHRSAIQEIPDISLNWKVHCHFNFFVSYAMEEKRGKELRLKLIVDSTARVSVNMDDTINSSPGNTLMKDSPGALRLDTNSNIHSQGTRTSGLDSNQMFSMFLTSALPRYERSLSGFGHFTHDG